MKNRLILASMLVSAAGWAQVQIPDGARVRVRLEQVVSSATAQEGETVSFTVADPLRIGNAVVIAQGSSATGTVIQVQPRRRMGRTGKLDFSIERVRAVDGQWIPVRYSLTKKEGGSRAGTTGVTTGILAVAFWPAAPFALLMKGKDATIPKGQIFEVFTDETHVVLNTAPTSTNLTAQAIDKEMAVAGGAAPVLPVGVAATSLPAPQAGTATVTVTSPLPGADIELDGVFVGSTPSTLQVAAGTHRVTVRSGGQVWERSVQIQAGATISLNAALNGTQRARAVPQ